MKLIFGLTESEATNLKKFM